MKTLAHHFPFILHLISVTLKQFLIAPSDGNTSATSMKVTIKILPKNRFRIFGSIIYIYDCHSPLNGARTTRTHHRWRFAKMRFRNYWDTCTYPSLFCAICMGGDPLENFIAWRSQRCCYLYTAKPSHFSKVNYLRSTKLNCSMCHCTR